MPLLLNCCISKFLTNQLPKIFIMNFSSRNFGDGIMSALSSRNDHHKLLANFDEGVGSCNHVCASGPFQTNHHPIRRKLGLDATSWSYCISFLKLEVH